MVVRGGWRRWLVWQGAQCLQGVRRGKRRRRKRIRRRIEERCAPSYNVLVCARGLPWETQFNIKIAPVKKNQFSCFT